MYSSSNASSKTGPSSGAAGGGGGGAALPRLAGASPLVDGRLPFFFDFFGMVQAALLLLSALSPVHHQNAACSAAVELPMRLTDAMQSGGDDL